MGVMVEQKENSVCINQWGYINSIREPEARRFTGNSVLEKKELTEYRSVVGQLNWISLHTMPDISYNVSELSKTFKEGTTQDMRKLIEIVRKVRSIMGGVTWFWPSLWRTRPYTDSFPFPVVDIGNTTGLPPPLSQVRIQSRQVWPRLPLRR